MVEVVGQVGLRVVPVTDQFPAQLQRIIDRTEQTARSAIKPQFDGSNIQKGVADIAATIDTGIAGAWTKAAAGAAGFTAAVFAGRAAVNQLISRMAGLFDQLQKAQIGFKSLLGETAGNNLLESIRQFAKESPFATQELVNYSQQLIGVGLEAKKVIPLLTNVGDLVASKGGDTNSIGRILFTLTQIQSVGRLTGQDALQLQSALVPITKLLADYLGKTTAEVKKLQEQGKISADTVFTAIQESGAKVAGAMNASVRTIQGAQSYLSDSILITFQNSEALKGIYDDMVQGIIKFADILSSDDVQATIDEFLDSVGGLYTEAKPGIEAFLSALGTTGLNTLTIFTAALEALNDIISAIPEGVIEDLAKGLALLAAVRAPLALVTYVTRLATIIAPFTKLSGAGAGGGLLGGLLGGPAGANQAATGFERIAASLSGIARIGAIGGGLIGGEAIKNIDKTNESLQILGGTVQGLAIGFGVGGPIGAAIGGLGGLMKGVFDSNAEASKRFRDQAISDANEVITKAQLAANYINDAGNVTGAAAVQTNIDQLVPQRNVLLGQLETQRARLQKAADEQSELEAKILRNTGSGVDAQYGNASPDNLTDKQIKAMEARADALQEIIDAANGTVENVALQLGEIDKTLADLIGDRELQLSAALGKFSQRIAQDGTEFKAEAQKALDKFLEANTIIKDAGRPTEGIFSIDPLLAGDYNAVVKAREDLIALDAEQKEQIFAQTQLRIDQNITLEETLAIIEAIAIGTEKSSTALQTELERRQAITAELAKSYQSQGQIFDAFRAASSATDAISALNSEFTTSNLESYRSSIRQLVSSSVEAGVSFDEITAKVNEQYAGFVLAAEGANLTTAQVEELAGALGVIPRQVLIDISIANYEQIVARINAIVQSVDVIDAGTANMALALDKSGIALAAGEARGAKNRGVGTGALSAEVASIINAADAAARAPKAKEEKAGPDPLEEAARKQEQAMDRITNALDSAAEAIVQAADQFKQSIKERTQLERGVSVNAAIKNADRQTALLGEFNAGLDTLRARGVTDSVLQSLEIDNIQDIRQVRKLLSANPNDLGRLVGAVNNRDNLADEAAVRAAEQQQRRTITEAIIAAAQILGLPKPTGAQAAQIIANIDLSDRSGGDKTPTANEILAMLSQQFR